MPTVAVLAVRKFIAAGSGQLVSLQSRHYRAASLACQSPMPLLMQHVVKLDIWFKGRGCVAASLTTRPIVCRRQGVITADDRPPLSLDAHGQ